MKKYTVSLSKEKDTGCFSASNSDNYNITLNGLCDKDRGRGISPMEMMLTAAGGCAGVDVLSMLKEESSDLISFDIEVEGYRDVMETPAYFREVNFKFKIESEICKEKITRCIELSLEKYCTVGKTLEAYAELNWVLVLNGVLEGSTCASKRQKSKRQVPKEVLEIIPIRDQSE
ncbi:MAG: OsmC family protein [Flavobacteriales bacterium]